MNWILKINSYFDKKTCYFYQSNKCILAKKSCIGCNLCIKRIEGIDSPKDYLSFVTTRNLNNRTFWFSLVALIVSIILLILKVNENNKSH